MIGISFWRVVRAAIQNLFRNIWLTIATTVIMTITLIIVSALYLANIFGGEVLQNIEQKVDLSVTFKENVREQYITAIAEELQAREDVKNVRIISSDEALQLFLDRHQDDPLIEESLNELEDNPLPANLFIVASEPRFYQNIAQHLQAEKYAPFIEQVNYEDSRLIIERLISWISTIKNVGFFVTLTFSVLVVLIMFNTVRLAIYSFREEIDIMRLVGASRWFIQGPFVIEAIVVALLSVVISTGLQLPVLKEASPQLANFFFDTQGDVFSLYSYTIANWTTFIGLQAAFAVGLAVVSSWLGIRRYLKE